MRVPAALVPVAAALAAASCGGSDPRSDEDQIRSAVSDYAAAVGGEDPERVCELLVTAGQLRRSEGARGRQRDRCRDRVGGGRLATGQSIGTVRARAVRVRGTRATARVSGGEQILLRRVDGRWRIVVPG